MRCLPFGFERSRAKESRLSLLFLSPAEDGGMELSMRNRRIIYTNKIHPKRSIMSTVLGIISIVSIGIVIFMSYRAKGVALQGYGFTGLFACIFSLTGLGLGISGARITESFKFFSALGIVLNLVLLLFLGFLVLAGT